MEPSVHANILLEIMLAHSSKTPQEITQSRPEPFYRIGTPFSHAIAILVPRPVPVVRTIRYGVVTAGAGSALQKVVAPPFISENRSVRRGRAIDESLQREREGVTVGYYA
jgi:hypothetical protein